MARDNGIGTDYVLPYPIALTIIAFLAIAMYNVIELTLVIFTTFKRRNGLYFYALLVAAWGIIPYCMGFFFKFYNITSSTSLYITLIAIGWPCMVTGQSLVLYSRLHLIARGSSAGGRWVLIMITVNAIICHVPIIVLLYGANSSNSTPFLTPYSIYEKVQITIFFLQEVVISSIYVWKTMALLRSEGGIRGRNSRIVMQHLVWVNMMIIALDITLLAIEYAGFYDIQTTYKAAVYGIKLKMEFSILNKLLDLFQGRIQDSSDDPRSRSYRTAELGTVTRKGGAKSQVTGNGTVSVSLKDGDVVKTTQVTVVRSERVLPGGAHSDVESMAESSMKVEMRRESASSSEIQIVNNGF
ncbi:uncharacterized protein BDR25DRAFT_332169 [Lindgomyces ingoldianus]|uniref:Uncharacterized protein n=1 Tax=Lindgomyces ingoldianus TaxID=673940 RepID=A0ACB6R716_9PLEO|nr:uncharacterized protein BDR25DRAFT_332169 [Lindgomyces ingoldianus]KAF2474855.1 hypothetical protein BDR25DRAFT_332169 [Lindgomyces ingoldianus]